MESETLEFIIGFSKGAGFYAGLIGAVYLPLIGRSRYLAPKKIFKAEEQVKSKTNLGQAYSILRNLYQTGGLPFSIPKKIRDRAGVLIKELDSEYKSKIEDEIINNLPDMTPQFSSIELYSRCTEVSYPDKTFKLENLSPTYKTHFLGKADSD